VARALRCIAHTADRLRSVARLRAASAFRGTQRRNPSATTISDADLRRRFPTNATAES
jgi:hypothetical protein